VSAFVQIRGLIVHHHLLIDDDGVYLIDGGFIGGESAIGKVLKERGLVFEDIKCNHWFKGGEVIEVWGGLEVIHLPGHTVGHCGFFQREQGLLFAGDLFANQFGKATAPPRILNDDHQEARASLRVASDLPLKGVFINHGRKESPEETLIDLRKLA
jgi:glyoxylase-like metal-dependent hydrolase (beta-lactamase superfamily II)